MFNRRGTVVYANSETARLLSYQPQDVLELDIEDFTALCQEDRLDAHALSVALLRGHLTDRPRAVYTVATSDHHLQVRPFVVIHEADRFSVLLLREVTSWRNLLIAETVMETLHRPLVFASSTCDMLLERLEQGWISTFELSDLARIIHDSVERAMRTWESFYRLQDADLDREQQIIPEPVDLLDTFREARADLRSQAVQGLSNVHLRLPDNLPPVSGSPKLLYAGLYALLEGAAARLAGSGRDRINISAADRGAYVQVDLTGKGQGSALQSYHFDALPFAIVEQTVIQHRGRLWFGTTEDKQPVCSFSLPVWRAPDSE